MKFIDQVDLEIIAGKGGDGVISFRHEHRVEKGGPDGGDGGNGGDVYFQGDTGMNTLLPLHIMKHIRGNDGENGKAKNMYGAKGKDVVIKVPCGTLVYEGEKIICDVVNEDKYLICQGGQGGRGNTKFKSSRNTVPKVCENGTPGQKKHVTLKLKVMADVGFVGLPSAGKSTILKLISNAKPKIADYAFTTLVPQLGLVKYHDHSFVVADLPGLIEGASQGKGLGTRFLRHIERCRLIAFVLDFGDENKNPIEDFEVLKKELNTYNEKLLQKEFLIIANKKDLPSFDEHVKLFKKAYKDLNIISICGIELSDIEELKAKIYKLYESSKDVVTEEYKDELYLTLEDDFIIEKPYEGLYEVSGHTIENIYLRNPLNTYENILRFNKKVKDIGLWDALIKEGIKPGDTVRILGYQFTWDDEE